MCQARLADLLARAGLFLNTQNDNRKNIVFLEIVVILDSGTDESVFSLSLSLKH